MTPERYQRVREIYQAACALPADRRSAYVRDACGADAALLDEVRSLLQFHEDDSTIGADEFSDANVGLGRRLLESGPLADEFDAAAAPIADAAAPARYRILRRIGEGGMGTVYEAEQEQPVRRNVALKVLKAGMDTRQVVARFAQERQALALMDHPHIARVLDAGATPAGRPFFAMELCRGDSITTYCDRHALPLAARLGIFVQVCAAVQHAHQKGIIHRDIKPSNVLVAEQDGRPHAKVIDFGIAKAVTGRLPGATPMTELQFLGTPEYMSPEQIEDGRDVDTRSDVYALGVLLYELLTGTTPFAGRRTSPGALVELLRTVRETEAERPSTRVRRDPAQTATIAAARGVAPQRLPSLLAGELDWIVGKAIEKPRERRYESAGALAEDVERYLAGEPVRAAPPSTTYRMRKFIRRHRAPVLGAAFGVSALLIGAAGTLWQAAVARREAVAARTAERDAREVAAFQAQMLEQIDTTSAGADLLRNMRTQFQNAISQRGLDPAQRSALLSAFEDELTRLNGTDLAADLIDSTILRPAAESSARQFADQPAVQAALFQSLATVYRLIGRYAPARPLQEQALEIRRRVLGELHADTLASKQALGQLLRLQGDFPAAQLLLERTLAECRQTLGPDHPTSIQTESICGGLLRVNGQLSDAERVWRDVLERYQRVLGLDDRKTLFAISNVGLVLENQGRFAEAEPFYRDALERRRCVLGPDHQDTLISLHFLGISLARQRRFAEAEPYLRETLAKRRQLLGESHPQTINSTVVLGQMLLDADRPAEAEPFLREATEKRRRVLGPTDTRTLESEATLAAALQALGREAESAQTPQTPGPP